MAINQKYAQLQTFVLAGAGVSAGDSSMTLTSFSTINGTPLSMSNFGIQGFGTCEPASGKNEEQIAFTGIVSNIDGTVTLTGVHTVLNVYPYTQNANFAQGHAGATTFVISNTAGFYGTFANKSNDETITGSWLVPLPTVPTQIANKEYVDAAVISGGIPATTTTPGISIEATQADIQSKTATKIYMAVTYPLFVNPATLSATLYNDYVVDSGIANAYVITPNPAVVAYVAGQQFTFLVSHTNTSASTLNVSGLGTKSIVKNINVALIGGELIVNSIVTVTYDGTNFQIQNTSAGGAAALSVAATGVSAGTANYSVGGTDTITHNLGFIPRFIELIITTSTTGGSGGYTQAIGTATVTAAGSITNQQSNTINLTAATAATGLNASKIGQHANNGGGALLITLATVTSTVLTITIPNSGSAAIGTSNYLWKVWI